MFVFFVVLFFGGRGCPAPGAIGFALPRGRGSSQTPKSLSPGSPSRLGCPLPGEKQIFLSEQGTSSSGISEGYRKHSVVGDTPGAGRGCKGGEGPCIRTLCFAPGGRGRTDGVGRRETPLSNTENPAETGTIPAPKAISKKFLGFRGLLSGSLRRSPASSVSPVSSQTAF